jgi:hypothetical protein
MQINNIVRRELYVSHIVGQPNGGKVQRVLSNLLLPLQAIATEVLR